MREHHAQARVRPSSEILHREWHSRTSTPAQRSREDITAPERIRSILHTAAALGRPCLLRAGEHVTRIRLEKLDAETGLLHWRCEAPDEVSGPLPYEVEVPGHHSVYRLHLSGGVWKADTHVTPLPRRVEQVRHRAHRRVPAPASLRVRLPLPGWLGREREVVDLSLEGLALRLPAAERLTPGRVLHPIELLVGDARPVSLRGEVRHVSAATDGTFLCGLRVEPLTPADAKRWRELVARALHPSTRTDGALAEDIWRLFIDSGYFNLAGKTAKWFEERHTTFIELGRRAADLGDLLCEAVWTSERGAEATLSTMKPYRSLWLIHQLARRAGGSRFEDVPGQMLRDLYVHIVEHARADPGCRWLAAYIESTVPFVRRSHVGFAERMASTGRVLLRPVRMIDVACDTPGGQQTDGLDVGPATAGERALLARELSRTRPASYLEALDLGLEALDLEDAARPWHAAGLERERHVVVARRGPTPVAAAVLEVGPPGTNPFRLLDSARLFPLSAGGRDAFPALLDAARRWFASRGRDGFVFLAEEDGDVEAARLHDEAPEAKPYLWIIAADLAPEFLEHIHEQTVNRLRPIHTEKEPS
ncbi:PilZ domain-containing protein [Pyxidicoccus fallax]|uniref:PilZ domain-containing protein n=1 Tax=Pyxidicoccus fallax TaxID=394095 RepID=A0A848LLD5_9BACT|nr:PilZ domain-containing protein [Pyxidicoccus fallax]NMO18615.1 PilZ domain-containing protein [Pyxidicoccus fallax]NPC79156.1 PilZ domain-containing protein [Pyxidicoccus fallax]